MPRLRFGVALLVPAPWAAEVDGLRRALGSRDLERVPPHLTLVPPVNVHVERVGQALAVLRRAAAQVRPFRLRLGPVTTFAPVTPTLHLGVDGEPSAVEALHRLRGAAFAPPLERSLTFEFQPHVTLAEEAEDGALKFPPPLTPGIGAAILLRGVVGPGLLFLMAAPFIDLPAAFLLMAAMPAGLHIVVLAHVYGLDIPFAAGLIVWTTMITVPILLVASVIV